MGFLSGAQGMQIHELRSCYNYYSENWIQKEVKQCLLGQNTTIVQYILESSVGMLVRLAFVCIHRHVDHSNSNASYLFPMELQQIQRARWHYMIEHILSYKMLIFNIYINICYSFSTVMNKSLHAAFINIHISGGDPLSLLPLMKHTILHFTVFRSTVLSPWTFSKPFMNFNGCHFFPQGGIQFYPFAT